MTKKDTTKTTGTKTKETTNPFDLSTEVQEGTAQLEMTPQLINLSNQKATELMRQVGQNPELHELANLVLDEGLTVDIIDLIHQVFGTEDIVENAKFLKDADEDQLSRLLESRRSDRSKAKSKGPRSSVQVAQTFIGSMYAELLVRQAWNKPFQPTNQELDLEELKEDQDALNRKIRSLQSKKSRLRKTAEFVEEDQKMLAETEDEIERLVALRTGSPRVSSKTVIKNADAETLRKALCMLNEKDMDAEELEKIQELIEQLG